jgi:predicted dehydrogenase
MTARRSGPDPVSVGVVGVGSMGRHHARVCSRLPGADFVGVADNDPDRAASVAAEYGTQSLARPELFDRADAVVVAVPTEFHYEVASAAIEEGVGVLVEKPLVDVPIRGRRLVRRAETEGVTLGTGHVERYNPAVETLEEVLREETVIAAEARRLGPPIDRDNGDVVRDLMIHDVDVLRSLLGADPEVVSATAGSDDRHVTATLRFGEGVVATLTASRVTQQKVRDLSVTAREARVNLDYLDQSVRIHRHSAPEYRATDGEVRYRHESVVERPAVDSGEPLARELRDFVRAVRTGDPPRVSGADGLEAVRIAAAIRDAVGVESPAEVAR